MNPHEKKQLERLDRIVTGMLAQARLRDKKIHQRLAAVEQAILELAGTLRETRAALEGIGISLPSPSEVDARVSQSADRDPRISA